MRTTARTCLAALVGCALAGGVARAQPADPQPPPPEQPADPDAPPPDEQPADPWADDDVPIAQPVEGPAPQRQPQPAVAPEPLTGGGFQPPTAAELEPIDLPSMFNQATGYLLPAGVILLQAGLDTGGGVTADSRIGLGDVAEFGFGTTDQISTVQCDGDACDELEAVQPYALAQFRMGVDEDRLFRYQPATAIGFRKSFTRNHDRRKTRVAELYLVASKKLGPSAKIHVGGTFWDASIKRPATDTEVVLHDDGVKQQLRPFGGIELKPLPKSSLLLELGWAPVFQLADTTGGTDAIDLRPSFSWGVRYQFSKWGIIESGVRIPDIEDINLLDAQIFGQLKLVSRRFSSLLDGLR